MTDSRPGDAEDTPPDELDELPPLELGDSAIEPLSEDDSALQRIPDLQALPAAEELPPGESAEEPPPAGLPDPEALVEEPELLDPPDAAIAVPNRTLGRYELVEEIGSGGFGRVWRAESKGPLGFVEEVAVKVVHPALAASDERALLTLADEARILSRLRHPNIVGLRSFESVEEAGETHHILVLEFVRGVTLESVFQLLDRMGRAMPIAAILTLWDDALAGLDHAHNATGLQGEDLFLVHRDLKPPNLMIDRQGNLRILDFGIAWARERLVHTMVGTTKGSPPWMSPEQIRGDQVDARCDLWVLGSVMFRLVTGEYWVRPARTREQAGNVLQTLAKTKWEHRRKAVDAALGRGGRLPLKRKDRKLLEELLRSCLEHQLVKRAQSAAEVRAQLPELSGWDPAEGRKVLGALSRGILKGKSAMASGVDETRAMKPVENLTTPGSPVPKRPE